jgi:DNA-binding MarR family transcriptional regulator
MHLELLLFLGLVWMDESLQATLKKNGLPTIGRSQSMILLAIESGTRRPANLARLMGVSRQAIRQQLLELEQIGLLDMVPDPDDGRAKIICFKEDAEPILRIARRALREIEQELSHRIGATNVERLRSALESDWGRPKGL